MLVKKSIGFDCMFMLKTNLCFLSVVLKMLYRRVLTLMSAQFRLGQIRCLLYDPSVNKSDKYFEQKYKFVKFAPLL